MINKILHQIRIYATLFPERNAIQYGNEKVTYKELEQETNYIAKVIEREMKGKVNEPIVIYQQRGIRFVEYMLGIMKCGCYYIPIEDDVPYKRVEYICYDVGAKLIVSDKIIARANDTIGIISVEKKAEEKFQIAEVEKDELVYVMYTSGSTGTPKGVRIMYRNLINLIHSFGGILYNNLKKQVNVGLLASFSFDASVKQIYNALFYGHTLVIADNKVKYFGRKIHVFHDCYSIDVCDITPSILDIMTQQKSQVKSSVRFFLVGGENLKWETLRRYIKFVGYCPRFINVYGPTECCVDVSYYYINDDMIQDSVGYVPIGGPLCNTELFIVDDSGNNITTENTLGEILVLGEQVGAGYVNLESQKFVNVNGVRGYYTGDMARVICGQIEVVGRNDDQVKIHGYRVELNEINEIIERYWKCRCVTLKWACKNSEKIVVYACKMNDKEAEKVLMVYLATVLPNYMIPSFFVYGETIPITNRGKIDKYALFEVIEKTEN